MITILVDKAIYRRLSKYVRYICAPTDPKHWVLYSVAIDKWNHIINGIIDSLGNETNGGRICPYPKFSNNGKYRMIQIRDLKTRTTVWDISFEDVLDNSGNIIKRIVHGIELDKVLASIDESVRHITQSDLCRIVESVVREYINGQMKHLLHENYHKQINPTIARRIIAEQKKRGQTIEAKDIMPGVYYPIGSRTFNLTPNKSCMSIMTIQEPAAGQVYHICEDDHCFVTYTPKGTNDNDGLYADECIINTHIFPELFEELKQLSVDDLY